jgi:mannosyltransferase OCH1-like enzyme
MEIVAKKHNFTFVCLNEDNVRDYIENYDQEFLEVRKKSIQYGNTHGADLLRILVLEQHGGMWVDSTTIFINGLTELENIMSEKYRNLITNRFSHEPDMLLFHFSMGQNRIW